MQEVLISAEQMQFVFSLSINIQDKWKYYSTLFHCFLSYNIIVSQYFSCKCLECNYLQPKRFTILFYGRPDHLVITHYITTWDTQIPDLLEQHNFRTVTSEWK